MAHSQVWTDDSSDSEERGESWYFPCSVCGETRLEQHHAYCGLCGDSMGMWCCRQWCCDRWYGAAEMCLVCFRRLLPLPAALQEKVAVYLSYAYDCHLSKSSGWSISSKGLRPVSAHRSRCKVEGESTDIAYIVDYQKKTRVQVLPDSLEIAPLCVLMLDQRSICRLYTSDAADD